MNDENGIKIKKPKFNIGDQVYLFSRLVIGKIICEKITGVIVDCMGRYSYTVDMYNTTPINGVSFLDEEEFFATKEELIKNL